MGRRDRQRLAIRPEIHRLQRCPSRTTRTHSAPFVIGQNLFFDVWTRYVHCANKQGAEEHRDIDAE